MHPRKIVIISCEKGNIGVFIRQINGNRPLTYGVDFTIYKSNELAEVDRIYYDLEGLSRAIENGPKYKLLGLKKESVNETNRLGKYLDGLMHKPIKEAYGVILLNPTFKFEKAFFKAWEEIPKAKLLVYNGSAENIDTVKLLSELDHAPCLNDHPVSKTKCSVRRNTRLIEQGARDNHSLFSRVPQEVREKISSYTGEPILSEKESLEIVRDNMERPTKK